MGAGGSDAVGGAEVAAGTADGTEAREGRIRTHLVDQVRVDSRRQGVGAGGSDLEVGHHRLAVEEACAACGGGGDGDACPQEAAGGRCCACLEEAGAVRRTSLGVVAEGPDDQRPSCLGVEVEDQPLINKEVALTFGLITLAMTKETKLF